MIGALRLPINQNALPIPGASQQDISHAEEQTTRVALSSLKQCCLSEMPREIKTYIWSYVGARDIAKISPFLCKSLCISSKDRSRIIRLQIEGHAGRVGANEIVEYQKLVGDVGAQEEWLDTLGKITEVDLKRMVTRKILNSAMLVLPSCKNIKKISIDYLTDDKELYRIIRSLNGLQRLDLSNCQNITDEGFQAIAPHLTKLQRLNLSGCEITDEGLRAIAPHLAELRRLNLSGSDITDEGLQAIVPHLPKFQCLDLSGTQITDEGFRAIAPYLTKLQRLKLSGSNITNEGLRAIAPYLATLRHLDLSWTGITDEGLQAMVLFLTDLQHLNLTECDITDEGLRAIAPHLTILQHLDLSWTEITDEGLHAMVLYLTDLQSLSLNGWKVTDEELRTIAPHLTKIRHLDLSWTAITDEGLRAIAPYLMNLETLLGAQFYCITDRRKMQQWLAQEAMQQEVGERKEDL